MSDVDTPRMPNFWWCPTHHLYRGGTERPCAGAKKLGDIESLRRQLAEMIDFAGQQSNARRESDRRLDALQARVNAALEASTLDQARAALLGTPTAAITQPDRSGRWVDGQLVPFGPRDLDGWQPTHPEAVAGD